MAITQTYVDYGAGNDYNGASFTDGAYTSATKVLAKNGAFTKTKVNHWLYLSSNAGGSIVTGYYKVATATDANSVILATDAGGGVDATDVKCTQATGTALLPFRSIQGALDIITRDATNGDQINIKASTAQVNQATLTLATYGAPAALAPLVLRGYTASANDGGIGEIDCNGNTMWLSANYDSLIHIDLTLHSFGNNNGIALRGSNIFYRCNIHKGASAPSSRTLLNFTGTPNMVIRCYLHGAGTSGTCLSIATLMALNNYFEIGAGQTAVSVGASGIVIGNIINCSGTDAIGIITTTNVSVIVGNTVYNSTAGTGRGIHLGNTASRYSSVVINNVVESAGGFVNVVTVLTAPPAVVIAPPLTIAVAAMSFKSDTRFVSAASLATIAAVAIPPTVAVTYISTLSPALNAGSVNVHLYGFAPLIVTAAPFAVPLRYSTPAGPTDAAASAPVASLQTNVPDHAVAPFTVMLHLPIRVMD